MNINHHEYHHQHHLSGQWQAYNKPNQPGNAVVNQILQKGKCKADLK